MSSLSLLTCGVPQGSVLGPILFTLYTSPLEEIIQRHDLNCMFYADDTQLYITCDAGSSVSSSLELCIREIREWMKANFLVLHDSKTDVIHFTSRFKRVDKLHSLRVGEADVSASDVVKYLGVVLDQFGSMEAQVKQICKAASFALWRIGKIRALLDVKTTERLVHAFVASRLDYCNSLLYGLPISQISKLQLLQNAAARLVTRSKKCVHITPILRELHWLPISERIKFKILLIVFKTMNNQGPAYLSELISLYVPPRALRSGHKCLLRTVKSRTADYGSRAFSNAAPLLWNQLPDNLRFLRNIDAFKTGLKTFLFSLHFDQ